MLSYVFRFINKLTWARMAMLYSHVFFLYLAVTILTVVKVSSQISQGEQVVWICEYQEDTIRCDKQGTISIISAFYGRSGDGGDCLDCSGFLEWQPCDCSSDVTKLLQHMCNGEFICQINSHNDVFGDPCPGARKFLRITYSCDDVVTLPLVTTAEMTTSPTTATTAAVTEVIFTTGFTTLPRTTIEPKKTTVTKSTEVSVNTAETTFKVTTESKGNASALGGDGQASEDNTVIIAAVGACVAAAVLMAGVAGFILWKKKKRHDSTEYPTSMHNNIYNDVTTSSNIQLTDTGAAYRTDGNCNPTEPANIADLYAKPNKKKPVPNVDQLYAKPMKKKSNVSNVDEMYAKPHKATGVSNNHCDNELDNEEDGSVDNILYETTGNITFTTTGNEEGYVDNELYGSTA